VADYKVIAIKANPKNPTQGFVKVATMVRVPTAEDPNSEIPGETIEVWTPEIAKVEPLNGQLIPPDWTLKDNKQGTGKVLLPPREGRGGGGGGYRQSKEAFEAEAASRLAWQQVEEERKDRRTAWMTAMERGEDPMETINFADLGYEWLRSSPAAGPHSGVATTDETTTYRGGRPPVGQAGDTSSAQGGVEKSPIPGDTSADTKPGEGRPSHPSSGFPIDATGCTHKFPSGRWVTWVVPMQGDRGPYCPKCGTSKLVAMEGTNADLGPA